MQRVRSQSFVLPFAALGFFALYGAAWLAIPPSVELRSPLWFAEQITYLAPFIFACVGGAVASLTGVGFARPFWGLLTVMNALILAIEVEYTRGAFIGGSWDPGSWVNIAMVLMPVALFGLMLFSASRAFTWSGVARARMAVSGLILFVMGLMACYGLAVSPFLAAHGITDLMTGLQGAFRMNVGVLVVIASFASVRILRAGAWRPSEVLLVSGVGIYGLALAASPHLLVSEIVEPSMSEQVIELGWMLGMFLIGLAAVVKIRGPQTPYAMPKWASDSRQRLLRPAVFHSASIAAVLVLAYSAALKSDDIAETRLFVGAAIIVGLLLVARDVLFVAERGALLRAVITDSETGVGTRRYFNEHVHERLSAATRTGEPVYVAIIGVDGIDRADAHGVPSPEALIAAAAGAIRRTLGESAVIARLSWDTFGIVLSDPTPRAVQACERARVAAARATGLGASAGVAVFPEHGLSRDDLRRAAEGALYWARFYAGDGTVVFDPQRIRGRFSDGNASHPQRAHLATLRSLADAVDARSPQTKGHSRRVAQTAVMLAERIGLQAAEVALIEIAALVHDIGKVSLPDALLHKAIALTDEEYAVVQEHSALGERIVASAGIGRLEPVVRAHHERWDGNGYPDRLSHTDIPLESRIIAICDAFEVMTTGRPYRPALSEMAALQEIDHGIGSQFDPGLAEQFIVMVAGTTAASAPSPPVAEAH